jgi:hypothetical protein
MKRISTVILVATFLGPMSTPAFAQRVGRAVGPRGGTATHYQGAVRSGTRVQGPYGGSATHVSGPYRSGTAVRGPYGGGAAHVSGPYRSGTAVQGRYGGTVVHGRGPYGSRTAYARPSYAWRGVNYVRPGWNAARVGVYGRAFVGYPGFRTYGLYYGLVPPLAAYTGLAFLSAGILTASYLENQRTVYVYVVNEGGQDWEYRVDEEGNILSKRPIEGSSY